MAGFLAALGYFMSTRVLPSSSRHRAKLATGCAGSAAKFHVPGRGAAVHVWSRTPSRADAADVHDRWPDTRTPRAESLSEVALQSIRFAAGARRRAAEPALRQHPAWL